MIKKSIVIIILILAINFCTNRFFLNNNVQVFALDHCFPLGDINCSGNIDSQDILLLLSAFSTSSLTEDLDDSGKVNLLDFSILLKNFGKKSLLTDQEFDQIFTFIDNQQIPWKENEKIEVKSMMKAFYPVIREIYGDRYDGSQKIQLNKLDPLTNENSYASPPNNIFLVFPLTKDTTFHELVHVFHYPAARLVSTYEEGFARAVEIEGLKKIYGQADRDFRGTAACLELYNYQNLSNGFGSISSGFANIQIERYELSAFAFSKAYYEDNNFFKNFNQEVYQRVQENTFNWEDIPQIFVQVKPTVENIPTSQWIQQHEIVNFLEAKTGKHLLVSGLSVANSFQLIERDNLWSERDIGSTPEYADKPLLLEYYDWNNNLFDSATITLINIPPKDGSGGNPVGGYYEPRFPQNYFGYYKLKAVLDTPENIETTVYGLFPAIDLETQLGIHGIVRAGTQGLVSVYDSHNQKITEANIVNGRFYLDVPNKGVYKIVLDTAGLTKFITKGKQPVVVVFAGN